MLVMELILCSAEDNKKKTVPSIKAFIDDVTLIAVKFTYGTIADLPELFK